jgi:hypothetical protein
MRDEAMAMQVYILRMGAPGNRTHTNCVASAMLYQLRDMTTDDISQCYVSHKNRILVL